ncbi:MAG: hypothetical protein LBP90_01945 [Burkholderiales bacterium]|jgi:hypothetical protein|nr:hypothetical protein [Burkholderiales bacterium]
MKLFGKTCLFLFAALFFNAIQAKDLNETEKEISDWMIFYYKNPRPESVIPMVKKMNDVKACRDGAIFPMAAFFSVLFEESKGLAEEVVREVKNYPEKEKRCYGFALALSQLPNKKMLFNELSVNEEWIKKAIERDRKPLLNILPITAAALDTYWGAFFASGDIRYVEKVISALPYLETKGDTDKLLVGAAAKWSLTSNAYQHEKVLNVCKEASKTAEPAVKKVLDDVIKEAQEARKKSGKV